MTQAAKLAPCPHCGTEIVRISATRKGFTAAEPCADGPWRLSQLNCDRLPLAMPAKRYGPSDDTPPGLFAPHDCPRHIAAGENLATIRETWRRQRGPSIFVDADRVAGELCKGDEITVYDSAGREMRGEILERVVAVRLKLSTYRKTPA